MKNWFEKNQRGDSYIYFWIDLDGVKGGLIIILEIRPIQNEMVTQK